MVGSLKTTRVEDWPDGDKTLWLSGTRPATLLDADGPGAQWREQTQMTVAAGYGQWLSWLKANDDLDACIAPDQRCTRDRLRAYIGALQTRCKPKTVLMRVLNLERALAAMCPDSDRGHLRTAVNQLPEGNDNPDKRTRLQEVAALVDLGHTLMDRGREHGDNYARRGATMFRDGFQIALLALRPIRLKNFWALELDTHITSKDGRWAFDIPI